MILASPGTLGPNVLYGCVYKKSFERSDNAWVKQVCVKVTSKPFTETLKMTICFFQGFASILQLAWKRTSKC